MDLVEKIYYDWSDSQSSTAELNKAYKAVADALAELIGIQKFNEIDSLIMECVLMERLACFKGGFQQATAIWKECC